MDILYLQMLFLPDSLAHPLTTNGHLVVPNGVPAGFVGGLEHISPMMAEEKRSCLGVVMRGLPMRGLPMRGLPMRGLSAVPLTAVKLYRMR